MIALLFLIVIFSTIWVGFDAAGRDWRNTDSKWVMARSSFGWMIGCLVLWIVFFPAYLAQRGQHPKARKA